MKKELHILITGAGGFLGKNLIDHIISNYGDRVFIYSLERSPSSDFISGHVQRITCDLTNINDVYNALKPLEIDAIVHLAGITGGKSYHEFFRANVMTTANLWEVVSQLPINPKVINVGSAAQYCVDLNSPVISEDCLLKPSGIYGLSKYIQEKWTMGYIQSNKIQGCCVRVFNIIGRQQKQHLIPSCFIKQIHLIKEGKQKELRVGNIDTSRDFLDVRDVAEALWMLMGTDSNINGEVFNIASGQSVKIREILSECLRIYNMDFDIVKVDSALYRDNDVLNIIGDISKIRSYINWTPRYDYKEALTNVLQYV
jgi:GDP-4-dehydro-6-deoxy-D-mannose reductase